MTDRMTLLIGLEGLEEDRVEEGIAELAKDAYERGDSFVVERLQPDLFDRRHAGGLAVPPNFTRLMELASRSDEVVVTENAWLRYGGNIIRCVTYLQEDVNDRSRITVGVGSTFVNERVVLSPPVTKPSEEATEAAVINMDEYRR